MRKIFIAELFCFIVALVTPAIVLAGTPLFTFTPLTATTIQVPLSSSATVQYTVQNQSSKSHTLVMKAINGVTQTTTNGNCPNPFTLAGNESCTLTLQINGTQIPGSINGGPVVCQQGNDGHPNPLLCYQPSKADILNITVSTATLFYCGAQNGNVYFSSNNGATWTVTSSVPGSGSPVNSVFATANFLYAGAANGFIYYSANNGSRWSNTSSPDGSAVNSVFVSAGILYASTANGNVWYSLNNGVTWIAASQPDGSAVNSIFVMGNVIYVGTANGNVFYSINNGATWTAINGMPDGSAVNSVYVANGTLFVGTANEFVYSSTSLTGGGAWTMIAQTVYSLFVSSFNNLSYAGTQGGYVYSLTNGTELGFVSFSPINSIYVLN